MIGKLRDRMKDKPRKARSKTKAIVDVPEPNEAPQGSNELEVEHDDFFF
jgi:hypothetical protein